jgi:hypothetical protein
MPKELARAKILGNVTEITPTVRWSALFMSA